MTGRPTWPRSASAPSSTGGFVFTARTRPSASPGHVADPTEWALATGRAVAAASAEVAPPGRGPPSPASRLRSLRRPLRAVAGVEGVAAAVPEAAAAGDGELPSDARCSSFARHPIRQARAGDPARAERAGFRVRWLISIGGPHRPSEIRIHRFAWIWVGGTRALPGLRLTPSREFFPQWVGRKTHLLRLLPSVDETRSSPARQPGRRDGLPPAREMSRRSRREEPSPRGKHQPLRSGEAGSVRPRLPSASHTPRR